MTACAKLTASASAPRRPSRTSRRQVNNWPTDNPYLRAVADTSRGALALSATIRRFSSGVQRRRAPVWITSSRDTFDIVVCSVIRLCLRGFIPQRKAAVAGGLPSKQLIAETRVPISMKAGRPARFDYEYERNGTANLFMMFAPLEGWRHVKVTDRHTAVDYARALKDLADIHFAHAKTIVLVQDNL